MLGGKILASPAAKRIAKERGIDLESVKGSGPDGVVLAEDVLGTRSAQAAASAGPLKVKETVQLTPMRRIVGERMTQSKQSAPHFYLSMDTDMTEITRRRNTLKEEGASLVPSINDFILKASARALRDFPSLNAAFTGHGVEIYSDINIGLAVALDEGLVVPESVTPTGYRFRSWRNRAASLRKKRKRKNSFRWTMRVALLQCRISACSASIILSPSSTRPSAPSSLWARWRHVSCPTARVSQSGRQ